MGSRLDHFKRFLRTGQRELNEFDAVIVVVQRTSERVVRELYRQLTSYLDHPRIRVIPLQEVGLSLSRNTVLENVEAEADFVWIMDDDVELEKNSTCKIRSIVQTTAADIYWGRVKCSDSVELYKRYPLPGTSRKHQLLRVSSIEMIVSTAFLRRTGLRFPTFLGLGTDLPSGEENVFLLDAYARGARIVHFDHVIARHPCNNRSAKALWTQPGVLESKGVVARKSGFPLGVGLLIRWGLRAVRLGISPVMVARMLRGYWQAQRLATAATGEPKHS